LTLISLVVKRMTKEDISVYIQETLEEETVLLADGFEKAFIGIARQFNKPPLAVYSSQKCIELLSDQMSYEEAVEYFEFNTRGAYVGESTPIFVDTYNQ
jgi:hypothetical protein